MKYENNVMLWDHHIKAKYGTFLQVSLKKILFRMCESNSQIDEIREEFKANGKSQKYSNLKECLPTFYPNISKALTREKVDVKELSQLMYLDIDFYPDRKNKTTEIDPTVNYINIADNWHEKLKSDTRIHAMWRSVSGSGLGILIPYTGLTIDNWRTNWYSQRDHFLKNYNLKIDPYTKNINRACFISYDLGVFMNEDCEIQSALPPDKQGVYLGSNSILRIADEKLFYTPQIDSKNPDFQYFEQSFIDIHFRERLQNTIVDGIRVRHNGRGHYWFQDGFPAVRLIGRRDKIPIGCRNSELVKTLCTFVWLNPNWTKEEIHDWLYKYAHKWCIVVLRDSELERMVSFVYDDLRPSNKLRPCITIKKNHFTSFYNPIRSIKLSVVGRSKKFSSSNKVYDAILECITTNTPINNSLLSRMTQISRKVVIQRAKEFNVQSANLYISETFMQSKEYYGLILEILPDFDEMVRGGSEHPKDTNHESGQ